MLGSKGGFGDWSINRIEDPKVSLMESSSSSFGSSKRAKAPSNITRVVSCLVDGCNSDLSACREYHRRHKVCEIHSKTPKVTIGGREQRFCQQCSRFHSLVEFDEGKRSCRKRLDGHNRRRRKPQLSESISRNTGRFLSNEQGTTLLSFGSQQLLPSAMISSTWTGAVKAETGDVVQYNFHQGLSYMDRLGNFPGSFAHNFEGRNQFKILQGGDDPNRSDAPICQQPILDPNSESGNSSNSQKLFLQNQVIDSDCALSLLSSASAAETREIGLSRVVPPNPVPSVQSLVPNVHYFNLSQYSHVGIENKPLVSFLSSHDENNANLHCQGAFDQNEPDSSSSVGGSHQTLSFRWE